MTRALVLVAALAFAVLIFAVPVLEAVLAEPARLCRVAAAASITGLAIRPRARENTAKNL